MLEIGIYQPETFQPESKYGLTVPTTTTAGCLAYLSPVMAQMSAWLTDNDIQRLVLVVSGIDSGETLERWQFNVLVDEKDVVVGTDENVLHNAVKEGGRKKKGKMVKEVHDEIQAIIWQITASVTFLPLLNKPCSFDLLIYTKLPWF